MKKITLVFHLILITAVVNAQFISDPGTTRPLYQSPNNVQGSAFISNNWSQGVIRTERGMEYSNLQLKYDVFNGELVFNVNDTMYRFTEPVKEFILSSLSGKNARPAKFVKSSLIHNLLPGAFAQELVKGKVSLYKHVKKYIVDLAGYNTAGVKAFEDKISYYAIVDNKLQAVELNKKNLQQLLPDKWEQVSKYMEENNLSAKNEAGWVATIAYYNSL